MNTPSFENEGEIEIVKMSNRTHFELQIPLLQEKLRQVSGQYSPSIQQYVDTTMTDKTTQDLMKIIKQNNNVNA